MFEIYKAIKGRKTYLLSDGKSSDLFQDAKKHYKCAENRIVLTTGWVLGDELYLKDPHNKKAKFCYVAYQKRK